MDICHLSNRARNYQCVIVNHLCEAKGEQDGEANKAQECFAEFVIPSGDSPPRNAGFNSVGGRRLPEGGAISVSSAAKVTSASFPPDKAMTIGLVEVRRCCFSPYGALLSKEPPAVDAWIGSIFDRPAISVKNF